VIFIACSFYEKLKDWYEVILFIAFTNPIVRFDNTTFGFTDERGNNL
jgi:hypothetical protein